MAKIPDSIIKELTQMSNALGGCTDPCDEFWPDEWCAENCQWGEPQEVCWRRWAEAQFERGGA